jgi:tetratricopeptide (TPR) repeat protein
LFAGCDGLLDTENSTEVSPDVAQENIEGIEAILTSVYNRVQSEWRYGREITLAPDVLADNTEQHPTTSGRYDGQAVNAQGSHITFWNTAYLTINEANYVIEGAEITEGVAQEVRDRLKGEALFHRGYAYFDLARTYGYEPGREVGGWDQGAIIRTEPTRDVNDADLRSRSTNVEVYQRAQSDLEDALDLLEGNDRGLYFANYVAANALLARLHLYLENWDQAITYADEAIAASGLSLLDSEQDIANAFYEVPNPESILELSIDPVAESLGSNDGLCPYTNPNHWFDVIPSQNLLNTYDPADYRNNWFADHTDGFPYTLKWDCSTGPFDDNIPLIRLPEMYLIKAEAHAEEDELTLALDALEELQSARGLTVPFASTDKDEIIDEVMVERRRELNFEGHRWYDLKRRGMDIPKQVGAQPVPYDDFRILSVLPQGEVDNNPNLDQNPGY